MMDTAHTFPKSLRLMTIVIISALLCLSIALAAQNSALKLNTQITNKEIDQFGYFIVDALSKGDAQSFNKAVNKDALINSALEGISLESKTVKGLREGLSKGLDQVGETTINSLGEKARLTYVRGRFLNQTPYALIRVDFGAKGLNYLDYILEKDREGTIRIIDWYDYSQGQLYSHSVRQALVLLVPKDKGIILRLLGKDSIDDKAVKHFIELSKLGKEQKYQEWLTKYAQLPDKLKYSRTLLISRVFIANYSGDEKQYRMALADLNRHFGTDPTLSLLLVDHYLLEGDYPAAHTALNNLKNHTGGDAAIDGMQANVYLTEKNYPESLKYAKLAVKQDPDYENAYWTLIDSSIRVKEYKTAVKAIEELEKNFGYTFDPKELAKIEGYDAFAKSPVFAQWKSNR